MFLIFNSLQTFISFDGIYGHNGSKVSNDIYILCTGCSSILCNPSLPFHDRCIRSSRLSWYTVSLIWAGHDLWQPSASEGVRSKILKIFGKKTFLQNTLYIQEDQEKLCIFTIHCDPFKDLNAMRVYSHSYWLVIFCTTNNRRVLARERWQSFENYWKNTIFNVHLPGMLSENHSADKRFKYIHTFSALSPLNYEFITGKYHFFETSSVIFAYTDH